MASPGVGTADDVSLTVGVAIAVPAPYASELRDLRASFGDTQADTVPTHVTLLPPTHVEEAKLAQVRTHLTAVAHRHRSFSITLRGTGTFRPVSPVVFVAIAEGIAECELLADSVRAGPLSCDLPFPYHPHVTVAHDVVDDELDRAFDKLAGYDCTFEVDAFRLHVHDDGPGWRTDTVFGLRQD